MAECGFAVGVLLSAVLHFIGDTDGGPREIVARLREATAPGSYLLISHVVADDDPSGAVTRQAAIGCSTAAAAFYPRATAEITSLFDRFALVSPGAGAAVEGHGRERARRHRPQAVTG
ncbi:MAG TPA: SAM-dependent methyltransferase [Kineosporiaceae bacterium]